MLTKQFSRSIKSYKYLKTINLVRYKSDNEKPPGKEDFTTLKPTKSNRAFDVVKDTLFKEVGINQVPFLAASDISKSHDIKYPIVLGENKTGREPRRMKDSYSEIVLPFKTSPSLKDEYINVYGRLRFGKLLEDLDALSGLISYKHCKELQKDPEPYIIVTASVDRIDLMGKLTPENDIRLSGNVIHVSSSSMGILIKIEKLDDDSKWHYAALAKFIMVARNPKSNTPVNVPPLLIENHKNYQIFQLGARARERKKLDNETSLEKYPPSSNESLLLHNLFLESIKLKNEGSQDGQRVKVVRMEDTVLSGTHFCQPQDRNMHNFIFGGYLMKEAFEIAFANASLFIKGRPSFVALDEISFKRPVPIGSILTFTSQIVYAAGYPHKSFQVSVHANVTDIKTGKIENTNVFHFTFESSVAQVPKIIPTSYEDAMKYLEGLRRKNIGLMLAQNNALLADYQSIQ